MIDFFVKGTHQTPDVLFRSNGILTLKGRSIPESADNFYTPVLEWLDSYILQAPNKTRLEVDLDYFNINSAKKILDIFYKLNSLVSSGKKLSIIWNYADDEMLEVGQDFNHLSEVSFQFRKRQDYIEIGGVSPLSVASSH